MSESPGPSRLTFDEFELRPGSGELLRAGSPIKLQPQPAKVLEVLATRSGEVVTREEIRQLVWGDSFVDFDSSLNFCIKQIRRALGDSATEPRYVETIPKRGYRFLQPVRIEPASGAETSPEPEPAPAESEIPVLPRPKPRARWSPLASLTAAGAAAVLLVFLIGSRHLHPDTPPRLAVLPLECRSQQLADRQVCGGITEALTAELSRQFPRELEVIAPASSLVYGKSRKSNPEIGHDLGASHLLSGAAEVSDRTLSVKVLLTRVDGGKLLWEHTFEADFGDASLHYGALARGLARTLGLPPPPAAEPGPAPKPAPAAYEAYLRGMYLFRQREFAQAVDNLQDAVVLDPGFAPAHALLSLAQRENEEMPPSSQTRAVVETAARHALELDPRLPEAHLAMAEAAFYYRLDWERGGKEYRQALALDPGRADTHHAYAFYLASLGRHDEAISSIERARELDPASMMVQSDQAFFFYLAGRYQESIENARETLELVPATWEALPKAAEFGRFYSHFSILWSAWKLNDEGTALQSAKELMTLSNEKTAASQVGSLAEVWEWRERRIRTGIVKVDPLSEAKSAISVGDSERALNVLERECRLKSGAWTTVLAAVDPALEPLHPDPRFLRILDCLGLPKDAPARTMLRAGEISR
ncbi:MAG TPA: winged helix-turn-helix domain-containing protein [Thermoanaerobaculia bacterium]|nr:winged helix-turn-helix domain-containing protein [Thermoanaerobaculia bacterium]